MRKQQLEPFKKYTQLRELGEDLELFENSVVIPKQLLDKFNTDEVFSFKELVTVSSVERTDGIQPIINNDQHTLEPIEKLRENPKLSFKPLTMTNYKIKTYRGYALISNELRSDYEELTNDIDKVLYQTITNTENKNILAALNSIEPMVTTDVDELRSILTTFTHPNSIKVYVTQEAFNIFDKAELIKQSSKYEDGTILGKQLVKIEGEGNLTFIGNLKEIIFFDRSINTIKFEQYKHYGEAINIATRHDVKLLNNNQIKKITFNLVA